MGMLGVGVLWSHSGSPARAPVSCQSAASALGLGANKSARGSSRAESVSYCPPIRLTGFQITKETHLPGARPQVPESNPLFLREDP